MRFPNRDQAQHQAKKKIHRNQPIPIRSLEDAIAVAKLKGDEGAVEAIKLLNSRRVQRSNGNVAMPEDRQKYQPLTEERTQGLLSDLKAKADALQKAVGTPASMLVGVDPAVMGSGAVVMENGELILNLTDGELEVLGSEAARLAVDSGIPQPVVYEALIGLCIRGVKPPFEQADMELQIAAMNMVPEGIPLKKGQAMDHIKALFESGQIHIPKPQYPDDPGVLPSSSAG